MCINSAYGPSGVHVEKLEDVLQAFTHGELFNIDRAWEHLPQLDALLARYPHVLGQALVKTPVREEYLESTYCDVYGTGATVRDVLFMEKAENKILEEINA